MRISGKKQLAFPEFWGDWGMRLDSTYYGRSKLGNATESPRGYHWCCGIILDCLNWFGRTTRALNWCSAHLGTEGSTIEGRLVGRLAGVHSEHNKHRWSYRTLVEYNGRRAPVAKHVIGWTGGEQQSIATRSSMFGAIGGLSSQGMIRSFRPFVTPRKLCWSISVVWISSSWVVLGIWECPSVGY